VDDNRNKKIKKKKNQSIAVYLVISKNQPKDKMALCWGWEMQQSLFLC
jgi:hypothetical protein